MFWKQGLGVVGRIGHGTVPDFDARWVKHPIVLIALPFRSDRVTQSFLVLVEALVWVVFALQFLEHTCPWG